MTPHSPKENDVKPGIRISWIRRLPRRFPEFGEGMSRGQVNIFGALFCFRIKSADEPWHQTPKAVRPEEPAAPG